MLESPGGMRATRVSGEQGGAVGILAGGDKDGAGRLWSGTGYLLIVYCVPAQRWAAGIHLIQTE